MEHKEYISEGYAIGFNGEGGDDGIGETLQAFLDWHELEHEDYIGLGSNEKSGMWESFRLCSDYLSKEYKADINNKKARYKVNKEAKTGSFISCASCGKKIIKKSYQTQFCSNKGMRNCKDRYWNNIDDTRRERAQLWVK